MVLSATTAALAAGGNAGFKMELPGRNHLFRKCDRSTPGEIVGHWLVRHTPPQH